MNGRVVGIDLGTSNSVVCAVVDGEAIVIADNEGRKIQPSVVSFLPDGRTIVGRQAKSRMSIDPLNTIYSAKRLIGRPFYAPEINLAISKYAYQIVKGADDNPKIFLRGRHYSIEEVQAIILRHMKKLAENYLGEPVTHAVITVPANFNEAQRESTKLAGELAGLEVMRILNEPTAAALAYGYDQQLRERIAVYDFGGGTFDITVLELRDNVFEVMSTAGDTFLGGDDFDHRVAELIVAAFEKEFSYDMSSAPGAVQRLKAVAERIKTTLSDAPTANAMVKQMVPGRNTASQLDFTLTRAQFDEACMDIVQQSFIVCDEALKLAGLTSAEVDRLVLVGGTTRTPLVRDMVENYFFKQPLTNINPDEVVAVGAAIYAFGLEEAEFSDSQSLSMSANLMAASEPPFGHPTMPVAPPFGSPRAGGPPPIPGRAGQGGPVRTELGLPPIPSAAGAALPQDEMPTLAGGDDGITEFESLEEIGMLSDAESAPTRASVGTLPLSTAGLAPPPRVPSNPFAVAGPKSDSATVPAFQPLPAFTAEPTFEPELTPIAAPMPTPPQESARPVISRGSKAPLLIDVTPHALGIQTVGGFVDVVIQRNASLPIRNTRTFATSIDRQETVRLNILAGASRKAEENRLLGEVVLLEIRPAPRGEVKIDVSFEVDADGILSVTARDTMTNQTQRARLSVAGTAGKAGADALRAANLPAPAF